MTNAGARTPDDEAKLRVAGRMMFLTAAIFVAAGAVWLISGTSVLIGVAFVAIGVVTAGVARLLLSRLGPSTP